MQLEQIDGLTEAQIEDLHRLFQNEWWTKGRTMPQVRRLVQHSSLIVAFCLPKSGRLIAFTRVLTDFTIKALILDVIVDAEFRNRNVGKMLFDAVVAHPDLEEVETLELYCRTEMTAFYERWGFTDKLGEVRFMRLTRS
jgi:ribosomal protein S18 acetylase RimI-like enzyme